MERDINTHKENCSIRYAKEMSTERIPTDAVS